ncbi:MAG: hypothetical protein H7Z76_03600 [Methylotenera sp.]|nr:hypothetical protein [Flavobacterium sp.]
MRTIGIVLAILGLIMTVFTGFNLVTKKKVVDIGSIEISKEEKTPIYWSPITGGVLLLGGLALIFADRKKSIV